MRSLVKRLISSLQRGWGLCSALLRLAPATQNDTEQRLSSLFTLVSIGSSLVFSLDPQANFSEPQYAWQRFTGQTWQQHRGRGWLLALHAEDRQRYLASFLRSVSAQTVFVAEARLWHAATRTWRHTNTKAAPLLPKIQPQGTPLRSSATGWLAILSDQHEDRQRQNDQGRLLSVMQSSSEFIALASAEGQLIYLNEAGRRSVGLGLEDDLAQHHLLDFFSGSERDFIDSEVLPKVMTEGPWRGKHRLHHVSSGDSFPVQLIIFATFGSDRSFLGFGCLGRDITEEEEAQDKLQNAVAARDDFLSIASHELKTPLTTLKLQLQLSARRIDLAQNIGPSPQRLQKTYSVALRQIDRLTSLVEDLLDVSRIRGGKMRYRFESVDVAELVQETASRLTEAYQQAGTPLHVDAEAPPQTLAWVDRFRIEQVVVNLLTNALKYGEKSPVEVRVRGRADGVELRVSDAGMGIAGDSLEKIFLRFERAMAKQNISGLGLGLYICKQIVDAHRGQINVSSTLGEGTAFTVFLPRQEACTDS